MKYPVPRRFREYILHPFQATCYVHALKEINLTIKKGEKLAILGPNGAGKTSLLKLIAGLLLPSRGQILVNNYNTLTSNTQARRSVGLIMNEERSFYWRLTGTQNLEFYGVLENLYGSYLKGKINELLDIVGLHNDADKKVGTYSSGMKQRLAIARGLLTDPDLLILDEPTRTLDPIASEELTELIVKKLHEDLRKTLIIATHRLDEVEKLCNSVCIINKGKIITCKDSCQINFKKKNLEKFYKECVK